MGVGGQFPKQISAQKNFLEIILAVQVLCLTYKRFFHELVSTKENHE